MSDCIIEFDNVRFEYQRASSGESHLHSNKSSKFSLKIDNLCFNKGEIYLIVGANGSGKTTLSKLMCGILRTDSGEVSIDDEDINNFSFGEIGQKISYLFQEPKKQFFTTNVFSEMTFIGEMFGRDMSEVKSRANELLVRFNLLELKDRSIYRLSRGESQRLAIASLLMNDLEFLILDEPTTGLDKENREILFKTITELCKKGIGLAIVSHDEELIEKFGDNLIKLIDGKLEKANLNLENSKNENIENGKTEKIEKRNGIINILETNNEIAIPTTENALHNAIITTAPSPQNKITHNKDVNNSIKQRKAFKDIDPRAKLFAIILMTTLAVIFQNLKYMAILATVSLIVSIILGGNLFSILRKLKSFVSLLVVVSITQIVFRRTGQPLWTIGNFVVIYLDGVTFGISTALRFFIILCSASVMMGENSKKVMTALSKMKIPYTFIFMMMIALRFLPSFRDGFKDSLVAIQLRGIDIKEIAWNKKIKLYSSLILPVVATAIVNSQDLAMSAEARGFGAMRTRTELVDVKMRRFDYIAMAFFFALFGTLAVLYYL